MQLNHDLPLEKQDALTQDKLDRRGFAESVVLALSQVSQDRGLVLSIEGKWGSGKTSTLAMVESLLEQAPIKPLVVHFNPWLVGDRDALLDEFFKELVVALSVPQFAEKSKEIVQSLKAFAKEFDASLLPADYAIWGLLGKVILSAAMWVIERLTGKPLGLLERKQRLSNALRKFDRPIVIVVDDVDRLMSEEVYEMVRIIKAVGDLPNIGYVLAWDTEYVEAALKSADVAAADVYLDKIVQVRMNLPALSNPARARLFNDAYDALPSEATKSHFPGDQELMPELYQSGLKQLLEQPRDIARLFNRVRLMEPKLRGQVVLADQIGWAALSLYAPSVSNQVVREFDTSHSFADDLRDQMGTDEEKEEKFQKKLNQRTVAIQQSRSPDVVMRTVQFLIPPWSAKKRTHKHEKFRDDQGRISHSNRFNVIRQWGASDAEVDLLDARKFILEPDSRSGLIALLNNENCLDFLEAVNGLCLIALDQSDAEKTSLFLAFAQALDQEPFATFTKDVRWSIERPQLFAWRAIAEMVNKIQKGHGHAVAEAIASDPQSLSMAATLLDSHWIDHDPSGRNAVMINEADRLRLTNTFALNVLLAVEVEGFWSLAMPGRILKTTTQCSSDLSQQIFTKFQSIEPALDRFAQAVFLSGHSSAGGDYYEMNEASHGVAYSKFCSIDALKVLAEKRLADPALAFPARAAWIAVATGKKIFERGGEADL